MYCWPSCGRRMLQMGGMQMGRLFDGSWTLWTLVLIFFVVSVAVIALVVVSSANKSKRSDLAAFGPAAYGQLTGPDGPAVPPQVYMQGMSHRSTATIFGVIGLFILGIVFGPLALVQANKAEALGVRATAGKVLGWISVGFSILWLMFIVGALASR
jgi:hypothetical protein